MATVQLTSDHSSHPDSCAGNDLSGPTAARLLSWENLIYLADFLWASGRRQLALSGGEPTVHPQCVDFILYLLDRGFDVTVYTDGLLNPARLEEFRRHLAEVPVARLTVVCGILDPMQSAAAPPATARLEDFLAVMGPWTQAGFNLDRVDFSLDFLFDLISRFGLQPHLRLSLTYPIPGNRAGFIPAEEMRRIAARLYAHRELFEARRVRPNLDCGWPLCHFSDAELGWLYRCGGPAPFGCGPDLHLSPDLIVSPCLPLAHDSGKSLFDFDSLEQIDQHFARQRAAIEAESVEICADCADCRCREDGLCRGWDLCRSAGGRMDEISPSRLPQ